jgi:hypothetical protein
LRDELHFMAIDGIKAFCMSLHHDIDRSAGR